MSTASRKHSIKGQCSLNSYFQYKYLPAGGFSYFEPACNSKHSQVKCVHRVLDLRPQPLRPGRGCFNYLGMGRPRELDHDPHFICLIAEFPPNLDLLTTLGSSEVGRYSWTPIFSTRARLAKALHASALPMDRTSLRFRMSKRRQDGRGGL